MATALLVMSGGVADAAIPVNDPATTGTAQAVRISPPPKPPVWPTGIYNLPLAPFGLDACQEMMYYAAQFGLPGQFQGIGYRESNCRNEDIVHTSCCHGYWQLHRMHFPVPACGAVSYTDINSNDPYEKQKQACVAKQLFDDAGTQPWVATR
jgi:hypothetical protein